MPVAQNSQAKLHPTCDETQAVSLFFEGIITPSTNSLSCSLRLYLIVPSILLSALWIFIAFIAVSYTHLRAHET